LFNVLFEMQNKNEIISLPGNYYAKIIWSYKGVKAP
jgi:hypothetical protein